MLAGRLPVFEKGWAWHGVPGFFVLLCILIIHKGFGHTWWKQDLLGVWEFVPIFIGIHLQPLHCHFSSHNKAGVKWAIVSQVAIQKLPSDLVVPALWNVCCKQPCSEADWLATNCVSELVGVVAVDGCKISRSHFLCCLWFIAQTIFLVVTISLSDRPWTQALLQQIEICEPACQDINAGYIQNTIWLALLYYSIDILAPSMSSVKTYPVK